tara:strand:+ start:7334 stop:7588 length:255 start_codon:yes stop_codon:yes gene_type:complete
MPATGEVGRKSQAEARRKLNKPSNPRSSNIIQPLAIPPMGDEEYIRLKCLEFATANSSKVGIEDPYELATRYANYVLTGTPDIA